MTRFISRGIPHGRRPIGRAASLLAFLILTLTLLTTPPLVAQDFRNLGDLPVGDAPIQIVENPIDGRVHVVTNGVDLDFDGTFEPGDGEVSAAWYVLDRSGAIVDSVIFDAFFNSFPTRAAFDFDGSHAWFAIDGGIRSYDVATTDPIDTNRVAVDIDGRESRTLDAATLVWDAALGVLYLTYRADDFVSPGEIAAWEPFDNQIVAYVRSGVNPGDGIAGIEVDELDISRAWIVNEGAFGEGNSSLTMIGTADDIYASANDGRSLPAGVERIATEGDRVWMILPRTRQIIAVNRRTHRRDESTPIDLADTLVPIAIDVDQSTLAVIAAVPGADRRHLLVFNALTGEFSSEYPLVDKADRVAVFDNRIYTAASPELGNDGTDTITIIHLLEDGPDTRLAVGPHVSNLWVADREKGLIVVGDVSNEGSSWYRRINPQTFETIDSGTIGIGGFRGSTSAYDPGRNVVGFTFAAETSIAASFLVELDVEADRLDTIWTALNYFPQRIAFGSDTWYIINHPGDFAPEPAILVGVEAGSGVTFGRTIVSSSIPMTPIPALSSIPDARAAYAVPSGGFGAAGAEMIYTEHHPNVFEGELGDGANDITVGIPDCFSELLALVTLNGSHEVAIVENLDRGIPAITNKVPTNTTGFDGPRASDWAPCVPAVFCGAFVTVGYDGYARLFFEGDVLDSIELGGKGEDAVLVGPDTLWVADIFETGALTAERKLTRLDIEWPPGSVNEPQLSENALRIGPIPATDELRVTTDLAEAGRMTIRLVSLLGREILGPLSEPVGAGVRTTAIRLDDVPSGTYLLRVSTPDGRADRVVRVVR